MPALLLPTRTFDHGDDLKKLASARRDRVRFVDLPEKRFLAIDGADVPGTQGYIDAIGALFGVAYPLHFALRARGVTVHHVGMLEALYWMTPEELTGDAPTSADPERDWKWRLVMAVPDAAREDEVAAAIATHAPPSFAARMYQLLWAEGPSAQILHVGSYESERPTLRLLHEAIAEAGMQPHGAHHEIYVNDPRRVGEARTKTVLRQPVTRA